MAFDVPKFRSKMEFNITTEGNWAPARMHAIISLIASNTKDVPEHGQILAEVIATTGMGERVIGYDLLELYSDGNGYRAVVRETRYDTFAEALAGAMQLVARETGTI